MTIPVKGADLATYNIPTPNGNGQAPMAASAPVVPASDWIPNPAPGVAMDGTDATGVTPPAGATGIRGWLSAIYARLMSGVSVTGTFWQATQPVSATALPLPAGAAADGIDATSIAVPTGGVGIRGWLSGIYGKLSGTLGVTGTFWQATQPVSLASLPLATGAALDSSLQSILNAIKATVNLTGTIWYDPTQNPVVYYIRRESVNEGTGAVTVSWWTPAGVSASPTVANLTAMSDSENVKVQSIVYTATGAGTGYATGDILIHSFGVDTALVTPALVFSFWFNAGPSATGVLAGAPTAGTFAQSSGQQVSLSAPLPAGTNPIGTVLGPLPAAPVAGQQTLTLAAAALPSNALQNGIVITAMATNTGTVYVGPSGVSATTGYPLLAGQSVSLALANSSGAYIIGTNTTDKIAFAGN